MKSVFLTLACLFAALPALAQSANVDVEVTLEAPGASCTFTVNSDLDFGGVEKPTTGSGSVTINARNGSRSASGAVLTGSGTVGQVRLLGQHVASYSVSRTFPSSLTQSSESLSFDGAWAQSTSANSGYSSISASSYSGTAGGLGSSFSRYFRFGGEVSGITWSDTNGDYTGSITTSATCN